MKKRTDLEFFAYKIKLSDLRLSQSLDIKKIDSLRKVIKVWKEVKDILSPDDFRKIIITFDSIKQVGMLNPIMLKQTEKGIEIIRGRQRIAVALELGEEFIYALKDDTPEIIFKKYKKIA